MANYNRSRSVVILLFRKRAFKECTLQNRRENGHGTWSTYCFFSDRRRIVDVPELPTMHRHHRLYHSTSYMFFVRYHGSLIRSPIGPRSNNTSHFFPSLRLGRWPFYAHCLSPSPLPASRYHRLMTLLFSSFSYLPPISPSFSPPTHLALFP